MADNQELHIDDGMTPAERSYFQSGGDVSDQLSQENRDQPAPAEPPAEGTPHEMPSYGDEVVAGEPHPRRIDFQKYQAEQSARMEAERQLHEMRVAGARVEERLNILQQAIAEPESAPAAPTPRRERPDPQQDIFGYAAWLEDGYNEQQAQLAEINRQIAEYRDNISTGQAEWEQRTAYLNTLNNQAGRDPNFLPAYSYLMLNRAAELMANSYPGATRDQLLQAAQRDLPVDVQNIIQQEERDLYRNAFEANRNPAEDIYRLARVRGFQPQPQQQQPAAQPQRQQQPARPGTPLSGTPAPAVPRPGSQSATDVINQIRNGQVAARSLSQVSGNAAPGGLTAEMLANMSDDEFAAAYAELMSKGNKAQ